MYLFLNIWVRKERFVAENHGKVDEKHHVKHDAEERVEGGVAEGGLAGLVEPDWEHLDVDEHFEEPRPPVLLGGMVLGGRGHLHNVGVLLGRHAEPETGREKIPQKRKLRLKW